MKEWEGKELEGEQYNFLEDFSHHIITEIQKGREHIMSKILNPWLF